MSHIFNQSLSFYGLVLNALGAAILVFFPNKINQYTKDGQQESTWLNNKTEANRKKYIFNTMLNWFGWGLLVFGFALQAYEAYV